MPRFTGNSDSRLLSPPATRCRRPLRSGPARVRARARALSKRLRQDPARPRTVLCVGTCGPRGSVANEPYGSASKSSFLSQGPRSDRCSVSESQNPRNTYLLLIGLGTARSPKPRSDRVVDSFPTCRRQPVEESALQRPLRRTGFSPGGDCGLALDRVGGVERNPQQDALRVRVVFGAWPFEPADASAKPMARQTTPFPHTSSSCTPPIQGPDHVGRPRERDPPHTRP